MPGQAYSFDFATVLWLAPLGVILGAVGTIIGSGGGFLLAPLLLVAYPQESPEIIAGISLAVVCLNAASGSLAYARMRRIDYRLALILIVATLPGSILGALSTATFSRQSFDVTFGGIMLVLAYHLLHRRSESHPEISGDAALTALKPPEDQDWPHRRRLRLAAMLSVLIGYFSTLLGIGGGIVHVPLIVRVLRRPVHIATATSHLVLATTALAGTLAHIFAGNLEHGWRRIAVLGVGVVLGAQIGALLSARLRAHWILTGLALAIAVVGVRLILLAIRGG